MSAASRAERTAGTSAAPCVARARSERPSTTGSARPAIPVREAAARAPPAGSLSSTRIASPWSSAFSWSGVPLATIRPRSTIASCAGQPVGLLEVVGGQQDRQPVLAGQPPDLGPELGSRLLGRARWSARRGTGRSADGPGPSPRRACGACRPSRSRRGDRPPRSSPNRSNSSSTRRRSAAPSRPWIRASRTRFSRPVASGSTATR